MRNDGVSIVRRQVSTPMSCLLRKKNNKEKTYYTIKQHVLLRTTIMPHTIIKDFVMTSMGVHLAHLFMRTDMLIVASAPQS